MLFFLTLLVYTVPHIMVFGAVIAGKFNNHPRIIKNIFLDVLHICLVFSSFSLMFIFDAEMIIFQFAKSEF